MPTLTCHLKPYIQPFERVLALRELKAIAGTEPEAPNGASLDQTTFVVRTDRTAGFLARRLAYWERVIDKHPIVTRQALLEATTNTTASGQPSLWGNDSTPVTLPNRRCLRFGPHGLHEYRGKFFPQLVRALVNYAELQRHPLVLDPMCGSGTTCVEAALLGHRAIGIDMNPLSVLMTRVKCDLLTCNPSELESTYEALRDRLERVSGRDPRWLESMPDCDQEYLRSWFYPEILHSLERIAEAVSDVRDSVCRGFFLMALSNVLRRVSYQKEDDLRVRRDSSFSATEVDPTEAFIDETERSLSNLVPFLKELSGQAVGGTAVLHGDARRVDELVRRNGGRVSAVVTSPPYATALPYIDTDRLSLLFLKLLPRAQHRRREQLMIGNREITERLRREYWAQFQACREVLPEAITQLVEDVETRNKAANVGFRRKNMGGLLAKYFLDMREVLGRLSRVAPAGSRLFFVVGNNHTYAGGQRVEIETASLLGELAESLTVYQLEDSIPMEMLVSRDIFKKNAMASEAILCLRRA